MLAVVTVVCMLLTVMSVVMKVVTVVHIVAVVVLVVMRVVTVVRIVVAVVVVAMRVVAVMHIVVTVVLVIMRAATVVYIVVTGALVVMRVVIAVHRWVCIVQVRRVDVCVSDITIQCVLVFGGVAGCADGASGVWSRSGSVLYGYVLLMCMPVGALAC